MLDTLIFLFLDFRIYPMKFQQLLFLLIYFTVASIFAQQSTEYRGEREKLHLLEHTKLKS